MAADETAICNLALGMLGQGTIMSLSDESQAARFCKRFYAQTRDEVLQGHAWNFAMRRVVLSRLVDGGEGTWAHAYQLPVNCLRVLELNGSDEFTRAELFEIEGRTLRTDEESAEIRYLSKAVEASAYAPLFVEALAVKLAMRLAQPLTGSRSQAGELLTEYERITGPKARRADACEGRPKRRVPWVESDLVRARAAGG